MASFPYKGDHVGSFLRPEILKKANLDFKAGKITQAELTAVEDAEIKKLVDHQVAAGLKVVTDGEFRRQSWLYDFNWGFLGVEHYTPEFGMPFANSTASIIDLLRYSGKIEYNPNHPFFAAFEYLKKVTPAGITPKVTIPSPAMVIFDVLGDKPPAPYTSVDEFINDLGVAYQKTIQHFYDIGLTYLQIDDCAWGSVISTGPPPPGATKTQDEVGALILRMNNAALVNRPKGLFIAMHNCRGNNQSDYFTSGPYDKAAKFLAQVNVDALFLEFNGKSIANKPEDETRCGGFECLKTIAESPHGKDLKIVLGLISTKVPELENEEKIVAQIKEASTFFPFERLCLSPQCGFASTEAGNKISEETQFAKVKLVVSIATKVWGKL